MAKRPKREMNWIKIVLMITKHCSCWRVWTTRHKNCHCPQITNQILMVSKESFSYTIKKSNAFIAKLTFILKCINVAWIISMLFSTFDQFQVGSQKYFRFLPKISFYHSCTESTSFRTIFCAERRRFRTIFVWFQNHTKNDFFKIVRKQYFT